MGKFKVGDRVRDISGYHDMFKKGFPTTGTISDRSDGAWVIDWDHKEIGRLHWLDHQIELVEETGPVRTVTRKEIVPGLYGIINIGQSVIEKKVHIMSHPCHANATELRAAIVTLTELANALDEA